MNKRKVLLYLAWAITLAVLISYFTYLILLATNPDRARDIIRKSVQEEISRIDIPKPENGVDARTPIKGIDYFDGTNGKNGLNASDEQVDKAVEKYFKKNPPKTIKGQDGKDAEKPQDGLTPEIRCNLLKNRWEVRYGIEESWQALNGEKVKCTVDNLTE